MRQSSRRMHGPVGSADRDASWSVLAAYPERQSLHGRGEDRDWPVEPRHADWTWAATSLVGRDGRWGYSCR